jgi:hypothetical protein
MGTYVPSAGASYNCVLQATDDTQYGANFAINLKTPGTSGMFNSMFNAFYIKSNGNVGIGTITPTSNLTVVGSTSLGGNLTIAGSLQTFNPSTSPVLNNAGHKMTFYQDGNGSTADLYLLCQYQQYPNYGQNCHATRSKDEIHDV